MDKSYKIHLFCFGIYALYVINRAFHMPGLQSQNFDMIANIKDSLFKRAGYGTVKSNYSLHRITSDSRQPISHS